MSLSVSGLAHVLSGERENVGDVAGGIVTIDAAGCQKTIAEKIGDSGGDYIFALKGNQGNLHKAVEDICTEQMENGFSDVSARKYQETLKGHGAG
ncbi:MAG: ISAs1 family transposase [Planctomycetota bacterium]